MKYRTLGRTAINVSEIGFGAWAIGGSWGPQNEKDSIEALHKALDLGVNFIDTAAGYGDGKSERLIAKVLKERKERIYVATKTPPADFRSKYFAGDRLERAAKRVERLKDEIKESGMTLPQVALKFALSHWYAGK